MKKLILVILMATASLNANAETGSPPFDSLICDAEGLIVKIEIHHYRETFGAGSASIHAGTSSYTAGWKWYPAEPNTRKSGYHFLDLKGSELQRAGAVEARILVDPYGEPMSASLITVDGFTSMSCKTAASSAM